MANHEALQVWPHGPWDAVHQSACCYIRLPTASSGQSTACLLSPMLPCLWRPGLITRRIDPVVLKIFIQARQWHSALRRRDGVGSDSAAALAAPPIQPISLHSAGSKYGDMKLIRLGIRPIETDTDRTDIKPDSEPHRA